MINNNYFMNYNILVKKIKSKKFKVGVVGLGYVGLPLAMLFAKKGVNVVGFDIDKKKISLLKKNISYIERISNKDINLLNKKTILTSDFSNVRKCDVIVICVPTPLKNKKVPDLSFICNTFSSIKKFLNINQILILESTSYPGTTREEFVNKLSKKFKIGENFYIGFSSERINPGSNEKYLYKIPKVVSGSTAKCLKLVSAFYKLFFEKIVRANSLESAEFSKLLENTYRSINIGFVNEMKLIADKMNLDIFEIIKLAKTKPFGYKAYAPGPSIGGHCIAIDPFYLRWKADQYGINSKFINVATEINATINSFIEKKIITTLKKKNINVYKAKILVLGIAYKKNIDDLRESGSVKIIKSLLKKNIKNIWWSDPHIKLIKCFNNKINKRKTEIKPAILKKFDLVLLLTDHKKFNYNIIKKNSKLIIDCRGKYQLNSKIIRA
jgi:UDP-N-acetyl-D-glucosamine dehydrogenase